MPFVPVAALKDYVGKDLGHSEWLTIDQERVDQFAECTGDHQFIHVDPEKAAKTPFGGTIAHGFLSLSLIPKLMEGLLVLPEGLKMAVNYGLDTVRFIQPVRVGLAGPPGPDPARRQREESRPVADQGARHPGDRRPGETRLHRRDPQPLLRLSPPQRALPFA